MKWFKHISDSLDDPFIFELITKHGSTGYLVFFGVLEIYAREFKSDLSWNLSITIPYLKQKFQQTHRQLITNPLQTISNSGKWKVTIKDDQVTIFIPKFRELMDEWSLRKLGSRSGVTPKILKTELDKDKEVDKDIPPSPRKRGITYPDDFLKFWTEYPNKVGKDKALQAWKKRNGDRPSIDDILKSVKEQRMSDKWTKDGGQYIPNPATWINGGSWADEVKEVSKWFGPPIKKETWAFCPTCKRETLPQDIEGKHCIHCAPRVPIAGIMEEIKKRIG